MKTNMKKYIALTMTLLGTAVAGLAQTANGTLTIQGTVASTVSITVAPLGGYNTLDIVNGVAAQNVANITEKTNDKNGYKVTMTSLNAGGSGSSLFLKDTAVGVDTAPYSLTYNGSAVTFSTGSATLTDVSSRTAQAGVVKALAVTIASSWVNSATYADTLTFTITGK